MDDVVYALLATNNVAPGLQARPCRLSDEELPQRDTKVFSPVCSFSRISAGLGYGLREAEGRDRSHRLI